MYARKEEDLKTVLENKVKAIVDGDELLRKKSEDYDKVMLELESAKVRYVLTLLKSPVLIMQIKEHGKSNIGFILDFRFVRHFQHCFSLVIAASAPINILYVILFIGTGTSRNFLVKAIHCFFHIDRIETIICCKSGMNRLSIYVYHQPLRRTLAKLEFKDIT